MHSTLGVVFSRTKAFVSETPSIVIIFMDDMGFGDPVFNGGIGYETPNIDKMASEGMRFTNFYAAQATCTASRVGILTGCYPNRIHMFGAFAPWTKEALNHKDRDHCLTAPFSKFQLELNKPSPSKERREIGELCDSQYLQAKYTQFNGVIKHHFLKIIIIIL